ncbi:hypothetical protein DL93DRAFT_2071453 [Clavulina sp. PMI_390]|nr:hypothetical protein DL93DRAFT_2071453 [Clavulina sp. PMI_390]
MRSNQTQKRGIGKVQKLPGLVLKQVAKAPLRLAGGGSRSGIKTPRTQPNPGENPVVILRAQVISCRDLVARDKGGTSDPYVVVSLARRSFSTPWLKKTLNPDFEAKDATFDIPMFASLAEVSSVLEVLM